MTYLDPKTAPVRVRIRAHGDGPWRPKGQGDSIEGWHDRIVVLWREDDARPPDRETSYPAFERIFGSAPHKASSISQYDGGDWFAALFDGGRVLGYSFEGGFVGIVAELVTD